MRPSTTKNFLSALAVALPAVGVSGMIALSAGTAGADEPIPVPTGIVDKVTICHATDSATNPYVLNEPAADGDVSGHADHDGPLFVEGLKGNEKEWGDIIPPFTYDGGSVPGLNWSAEGMAIWANGCVAPVVEPTQ
jgi:hypothetical protein